MQSDCTFDCCLEVPTKKRAARLAARFDLPSELFTLEYKIPSDLVIPL